MNTENGLKKNWKRERERESFLLLTLKEQGKEENKESTSRTQESKGVLKRQCSLQEDRLILDIQTEHVLICEAACVGKEWHSFSFSLETESFLCSLGWPGMHALPASTSQVLKCWDYRLCACPHFLLSGLPNSGAGVISQCPENWVYSHLFLFFLDTVLLCNPNYTRTCCIQQAGL